MRKLFSRFIKSQIVSKNFNQTPSMMMMMEKHFGISKTFDKITKRSKEIRGEKEREKENEARKKEKRRKNSQPKHAWLSHIIGKMTHEIHQYFIYIIYKRLIFSFWHH